MAKLISIKSNPAEWDTTLTKALQSGNINFLIGSGASLPAISTAGDIETSLDRLYATNRFEFHSKRNSFLSMLDFITGELVFRRPNANIDATALNYKRFLLAISRILEERKTELLPKQVTVFTTNYDLFIESAAEEFPNIRLNDGFARNPSVRSKYKFQPEQYFDATYKTGSLFRYRLPIPTINLVKLHGSLSWTRENDELVYQVSSKGPPPPPGGPSFEADSERYASSFEIIAPTQEKFHTTLLTRVYYDLLRLFANSLEVENTTLISFGFSFRDVHISDLVRRGLKNPTLLLLIIAYDSASIGFYDDLFRPYNNVLILHPEDNETIDFPRLNSLLAGIVPKTVNG